MHLRSEEAEETIVMKHALRNTTALLRGLAAGNLTDIASLLSGAYAEISSISSWLLGSRQEEQESMQKGSKNSNISIPQWAPRCQNMSELYFIDP